MVVISVIGMLMVKFACSLAGPYTKDWKTYDTYACILCPGDPSWDYEHMLCNAQGLRGYPLSNLHPIIGTWGGRTFFPFVLNRAWG
jgi:hypothetical protein